MSTIEETTPLLFPGPFYLPVVLPPDKFFTIPTSYYEGLATKGVTVTASVASPTAPLEITVGISVNGIAIQEVREVRKRVDGKKQKVQITVKAEDVYALTAGFASLDAQGKVVLRLWPADFQKLVKSPIGQRPNRIVYGSLDATSIRSNFATYIGELPKAVLQESWTQKSSGVPPDDEATLRAALLARFLKGDASIYVEAGAVLGTGTKSGDSMSLTLECFFDPGDPLLPTIAIPAEDLIDNARQLGRLLKFAGHPLVKAVSDFEVEVRFKSQFLIWNNASHGYEPFAGQQVTLLATPPVPIVPEELVPAIEVGPPRVTDAFGRVDFTAKLPSRATIRFRYATNNLTLGTRVFDADIETDPHKARSYIDASSVNAHSYKAKYEIYPRYQQFIDDIAARGKWEAVEQDRGNADDKDQSKPDKVLSLSTAVEVLEVILPDKLEPRIAFSQHELHAQVAGFEAFYKLDAIPARASTFNLLVEGDSWTNYPLAFNDLYSHLDDIFQRKLIPGMSYNRLPLQHYGDRGSQMFVTGPGGKRQFDFTTDFLREYQIDLILCSAGGNDFAEPGISADFDVEPYDQYIVNGYFDPYLAQGALTPSELAQAIKLMEGSFAVLLRNHPWNFFVRGVPLDQEDETMLGAYLDPLLAAIGNFGYTPEQIEDIQSQIAQIGSQIDPQLIVDPEIRYYYENAVDLTHEAVWAFALRTILQEIGTNVIATFPDAPLPGSSAAMVMEKVFDTGGFFDKRYAAIEQYWRIILNAAKPLGIPVISHTYGYPLFSEAPASLLGLGRSGLTGPWFTHRFAEAQITDRRVQKICLKAFLDHFERTVFQKFKTEYLFDYVDSRKVNADVTLWRDELHLRAAGYKTIAEALAAKARQWPAVALHFEA